MTKYELRLVYPALFGFVPLFRRMKDFLRGLTVEEASTLLYKLFQEGDFFAFIERDLDRVPHADLFEHLPEPGLFIVPLKAAVTQALIWEPPEGEGIMYCLSPKGAERWAEATRPDWSKHLLEENSSRRIIAGEFYECRFTGSDSHVREGVERFFPESLELPGGVTYSCVHQWHASYWKTFDRATLAVFPSRHTLPQGANFNEWGTFSQWYTLPNDFWDPLPYEPWK